MNYLAHLLLSGPDPDMQVGGLLGDFVKGPLHSHGYPDTITEGIRLHRRLDSFTDRQPAFAEGLALLPRHWRRYGGIILDIYFDHLLAGRWRQYHEQPLADYCADFYRHLASRQPLLPPAARRFCEVAPRVSWLENYASPEKLPLMLDRVGDRLRRPVPLGQAWPDLENHRGELTDCFDRLMPALLKFSLEERMIAPPQIPD